jgi:Na+/H+-dicarboxylate symporter
LQQLQKIEAAMPWYKKLHWQIVFGLIAGAIYGFASSAFGWNELTTDYIKPVGTIFINLLKLIAVPLILASLITGVASLSDLRKLSRIGGKTISIYVVTTAIAVSVGLVVVNLIRPGHYLAPEMRDQLMKAYAGSVQAGQQKVEEMQKRSPLQPIVDIVPENVINSAADNRNMLQVVFVALLLGIGLIQVNNEKGEAVRRFFEGLNEVIIKLVDFIMLMAPYGVFSLIAAVIADLAGNDPRGATQVLSVLGIYGMTVVLGLAIHGVLVYSGILKIFSKMPIRRFFRGIRPVQLLAFSSSSSGATLPLTMEYSQKKLGVSEEVASFALPLGATVNMDGTALYQGVAAVFIAQTLNLGLSVFDQLTIVLTATLASIGTAAVPGAGVIMLVIILQAIHVPVEGIALILGIDRILDMCRTTVNVTGDCMVSVIVAQSEGALREPEPDEEMSAVLHRKTKESVSL